MKAFLSRLPPEAGASLTRFLPEQEKQQLESFPLLEEPLTLEKFSNEGMLDKVHWSWFLPTLKLYPESEQKLFLSALSPHAEKNLAKALTLSIGGEKVTEVGKAFLRKILLDSLMGPKDQMLPRPYLPPSKLKRLLNLTKKELTHLIERLSIYDLNAELRQIIETKMLKKIYSFLSEEERTLLKNMGPHKDTFVLGRMGLEKWDGSEESLRTLMHKRGLVRFGAGLSGQDPDFIWTLCHQLDIGRGTALYKLCMQEPIHAVTDAIIAQIEENV
ncbi:MAG: hypothetical protein KGQ49_00595 [Verrucomicrobia bacterium]|nr:hypothetical protein [Verrucomicrobiota bacterium]MDE3048113.1 hypothetical protein [Verrucomicrobiota bacterium]